MGKNLKGREIGEGLCQRKDGRYVARFKGKSGKKYEKYFKELSDAKVWIEDIKYAENHDIITSTSNVTVNDWYSYWINNIKKGTVKERTIEIYENFYNRYVRDKIGNLQVNQIKTLHCQKVLSDMDVEYNRNTIRRTLAVMNLIFKSAIDNDIISKNPCSKVVIGKLGKEPKKVIALTIDEQKALTNSCKFSNYNNCFLFVLQTGLRVGEVTSITWDDVDFKKRTLTVRRTIRRKYNNEEEWVVTTPKTKAGTRTIPLTETAIELLKLQKEQNQKVKVVSYEWKDLVFLHSSGNPIDANALNESLSSVCSYAKIKRISMHSLRHTFATRCLESGMKPKTLQLILGHSNISTTLNLYVHIMEDEKEKEINRLSEYLEHLA